MTMLQHIGGYAQTGHDTSYFTVFLGDEVFGLSVHRTQTIFRISSLTPVPLGPKDVAGLVNLRGKIITAVSLRRRLNMPCEVSFMNALAITVEHSRESFALIVDRVGDVLSLKASMRIPAPPHLDVARLRMTYGLYRLEDLLVPVLNIDAILDLSR